MIENTQQTQRAQRVRAQGLAYAVAHQLSGLTRQAYADRAGISVYKLDYWRALARRLKAAGDKPAIATVTNTPPPASQPILAPMLFMEINRAAGTECTVSSSHTTLDVTARHDMTSNLNICCANNENPTSSAPAALPIELHLGGAWQGHRLCVPTTIDDTRLASLLRALPKHALSNAPRQSAPPPPSPPPSLLLLQPPSTIVKPSRANGLATS